MLDRKIENLLMATRWLLLPFYVLLLITLVPLFYMVVREVIHLMPAASSGSDADLVLIVLSVLDLVLLANLVLMVAVSSFESYISRIEVEEGADRPEWLGKLDSGGVKVKVALSITMISAVHLLRDFMKDTDPRQLVLSSAVLLSFVLTSFLVAKSGIHGSAKH